MPAQFAAEINEANAAAGPVATAGDDAQVAMYESGPGPFIASYSDGKWYPTSGFRNLVQSGTKFKWTLNTRGDLGVVKPTLKHSIAAGGGDVLTAGHGTYTSATNTMTLDNDTGHYRTSEESLTRSRAAWTALGYVAAFQARKDYTAALAKLAF
jgi:hypothetical protein